VPSGAIRSKSDQTLLLVSIQSLDRLSQTELGVLAGRAGERVVDPGRPAQLLESRQDRVLSRRRLLEALDQPAADP